MLRNFSFVIKDRLAGAARPGSFGGSLRADLEDLREEGVTALVSLSEQELDRRAVRDAGLDYLHLPVEDFTAPSLKQIRRFVEFSRRHLDEEKDGAVTVHCRMGIGRTGTMLACYLVSTGLTADEAIRTVRRLRPGSIETGDQERAVKGYQAYLQEMDEWRPAARKAAAKKGRRPSPKGKAAAQERKKAKPADRRKKPAASPKRKKPRAARKKAPSKASGKSAKKTRDKRASRRDPSPPDKK